MEAARATIEALRKELEEQRKAEKSRIKEAVDCAVAEALATNISKQKLIAQLKAEPRGMAKVI